MSACQLLFGSSSDVGKLFSLSLVGESTLAEVLSQNSGHWLHTTSCMNPECNFGN